MIADRLERALARSAERAGAPLHVETHRVTAWHSATFSGDRHELVASAASGDRLERWLSDLGDLDVQLPGTLIAELTIAGYERAAETTRFTINGVTLRNP